MTATRPLVVVDRPVCDYERPARCRRTAVVSIDGVYRCSDHQQADEFGRTFAGMARPIVWQR